MEIWEIDLGRKINETNGWESRKSIFRYGKIGKINQLA